jgi:hypothetical protein
VWGAGGGGADGCVWWGGVGEVQDQERCIMKASVVVGVEGQARV